MELTDLPAVPFAGVDELETRACLHPPLHYFQLSSCLDDLGVFKSCIDKWLPDPLLFLSLPFLLGFYSLFFLLLFEALFLSESLFLGFHLFYPLNLTFTEKEFFLAVFLQEAVLDDFVVERLE